MDSSISGSINTADRTSYITNESTPLQNVKIKNEGFKYIVGTFSVVTLIITVGLGVTINQDPDEIPFGSGVASDHSICTEAGNEIFMKGGNAIDVAIAVTICLGVVLPHLTGIGGNGLILVYNHKTEKALMCMDSWPPPGTVVFPQLMLALNKVHSAFGHKSWSVLLEPALRIANEGFPVSTSLVQSLKHLSPNADDDLKSWLQSLNVGMIIKSPQVAVTLGILRDQGVDALYNGTLSQELKKYFDAATLSEPVLNNQTCAEAKVEDYHLISSGLGSAGPFLLNTFTNPDFSHNATVQEIADFLLGKEELTWSLPSGVVVAVADKDDNYISIVSGLGPVLGLQKLLKGGYILGSPLHHSNLSGVNSYGASVVITKLAQKCENRFITGGVDVRDLLQVLPKLLWAPEDIQSIIEAARVRITQNGLFAESEHSPLMPYSLSPAPMPYPSINIIQKRGDDILAYSDSRSH